MSETHDEEVVLHKRATNDALVRAVPPLQRPE